MLKLNSFLNGLAKSTIVQPVREFKTKGEYFRRVGYEYNKMYKGGKIDISN
jgi:hypothetical protein